MLRQLAADALRLRPKPLPIDDHGLGGIHVLRTLDDALALRDRLAGGGGRVVVIGAGFIGLEVAATARQLGHDVLVLEGAEAPLIRALGPEMGAAVSAIHADHGVEIRCGVQVAGLEGEGGRVRGVRLASGEVVPADVVVVGIGVTPATGWLEGSGLSVREVDITQDAALFERVQHDIPVLEVDGQEIARHRIAEPALVQTLRSAGVI